MPTSCSRRWSASTNSQPEALGQAFADGGLAGAHRADQNEIWRGIHVADASISPWAFPNQRWREVTAQRGHRRRRRSRLAPGAALRGAWRGCARPAPARCRQRRWRPPFAGGPRHRRRIFPSAAPARCAGVLRRAGPAHGSRLPRAIRRRPAPPARCAGSASRHFRFLDGGLCRGRGRMGGRDDAGARRCLQWPGAARSRTRAGRASPAASRCACRESTGRAAT